MRGLYASLLISLAVTCETLLIVAAPTETLDDHDLAEEESSLEKESSAGNSTDTFTLHHHHHIDRECGENEIWGMCGRVCEKTCKRRGICLVKLCSKEWSGCHCKLGFVRNRKNKCIRPRECKICNRPK
ncbi:uncharacterized protein LOC144467556 [Augochlora pura]